MYSASLSNNPSFYLATPSPASLAQCGYKTQASCREQQPYLPRGLCTPPADPNENEKNMATTFEVSHLAACENYPFHHPSSYSSVPSSSDRRRSALNERAAPNEQIFNPTSRCPAQLPTHNHAASSTQARPSAQPAPFPTAASSRPAPDYRQRRPPSPRHPARSSTASSRHNSADVEQGTTDNRMTTHSLNTPVRICPKGGDLSAFTAEVTALFWFESTKTIQAVEKARVSGSSTSLPPLAHSAVATQHFKKWVLAVLTTTQVTQNVVVLALLYVYRLKMANPTVKGRAGSEYRLLTVALMLGNKFLDDNTYTNKTWADVSGISVTEIHVMEVEFLSNMRYSLLVSAEEWEQWLDKVAGFWSYLELAQRPLPPVLSPLLIPSPVSRSFVSPLPSPTGPVPSTSNMALTAHPLSAESQNQAPQNWPALYMGSNAVSPLALKPQAQPYLKRNFPEEDTAEHPAKRVSRVPVGQGKTLPQPAAVQQPAVASQLGSQHPGIVPALRSRPAAGVGPEQGRLAVPSLTLNTAQLATAPAPVAQPQPYAPPQGSSLSLPPLVPGVRAMATVFPTTTYAPAQSTPAVCGTVTPTTSYPPMSYGTPTKRLSPQNSFTASAPYTGSSPLIDPLGHHMGTPMGNVGTTSGLHTPISHSPSIYLQQRNSPYKPVRHVNTLLYPPPSAFLQQYHLPNAVLPNQMHYRPIGKRVEYRTGILPEFALASVNPQGLAAPVMYPPAPQILPNLQQPRASHPASLSTAHGGPYAG